MTKYHYKSATDKLAKAGVRLIALAGATNDQIVELENLLGSKLPDSYKTMLSESGILGFEGQMISGIGRDGVKGSNFGNVFFATMNSRENNKINFDMVWIMASGYGPDFVIDCAKLDQNDEAPVYEIDELGYETGMKKVADSFGEFLLNEVNMALPE